MKKIFDYHWKLQRVCARSKRWWSKELSLARSKYNVQRRDFQGQKIPLDKYKSDCNAYYRKIRKAKDLFFEKWIQGDVNLNSETQSNMLEMEELSNVKILALVINYESFTINCIAYKLIIKHQKPLATKGRLIYSRSI